MFHPSGNIVDPGSFAPLGQVVPCPPEDLDPSGFCLFDFSRTILESTNPADRISALIIGNVKLGSVRAFGEALHSRSEDTFLAQPAPGFFTDQSGRFVAGRFLQPGPRTTERTGTLTQFTAGLEGTFGSIDWDVVLGRGISKVVNQPGTRTTSIRPHSSSWIANGSIDREVPPTRRQWSTP